MLVIKESDWKKKSAISRLRNNFGIKQHSGRGKAFFNAGRRYAGFTLLELIIALSIVSTLGAIGTTQYVGYIQKARVINAASAIADLSLKIASYQTSYGVFPNTLNDLKPGNILDPWGRPYQYLNIANGTKDEKGKARKDRFLVPINSDFDLYSMGKDGKTQAALTSSASRDDIIRANDGSYIGKAEGF
jgi:general secretion pathway protein G